MIQATDLGAVVRCGGCGEVPRRELGLFVLSGGRTQWLRCDCGRDLLQLTWLRGRGIRAGVACAVCLGWHQVVLPAAALLGAGAAAPLLCPATDVELGFLGPPGVVHARAEPWLQELARAGAYANMGTYPVSRGTMRDLLDFLYYLTRDGKFSSLHENRSADPWDADS